MTGKPYHYTECGLESVYLLDGFEIEETAYGWAVRFQNVDGLHKAIAMDLIHGTRRLNGNEFRFLRTELGLTQANLGNMLDVDSQTVARWEKGQSGVSGPADKMLRFLYEDHVGERVRIRGLLEQIADLDCQLDDRTQQFQTEDNEWRPADAA